MECLPFELPGIIYYAIMLGPAVVILYMSFWIMYSYKKLLYQKAQNHDVEFINNEPIVLLPEEDYMNLKYGTIKGPYN